MERTPSEEVMGRKQGNQERNRRTRRESVELLRNA